MMPFVRSMSLPNEPLADSVFAAMRLRLDAVGERGLAGSEMAGGHGDRRGRDLLTEFW